MTSFQNRTLKTPRRLLFVLLFPQTGYEYIDFMDWLLVDYLLQIIHLDQKQHFQLNITEISTVCPFGHVVTQLNSEKLSSLRLQ